VCPTPYRPLAPSSGTAYEPTCRAGRSGRHFCTGLRLLLMSGSRILKPADRCGCQTWQRPEFRWRAWCAVVETGHRSDDLVRLRPQVHRETPAAQGQGRCPTRPAIGGRVSDEVRQVSITSGSPMTRRVTPRWRWFVPGRARRPGQRRCLRRHDRQSRTAGCPRRLQAGLPHRGPARRREIACREISQETARPATQ